jgi:hypothetical protein
MSFSPLFFLCVFVLSLEMNYHFRMEFLFAFQMNSSAVLIAFRMQYRARDLIVIVTGL